MATGQWQTSRYPKVEYQGRLGYAMPIVPGKWLFVESASGLSEPVANENELRFLGDWQVVEWWHPL